MGNRLSKIYTKTGDTGTTGMATGERIAKFHPRMEAIGDIDELNSYIGVLIASLPSDSIYMDELSQIQHDCFDLGGELAMPGHKLLPETSVIEIENFIERINADLPPLKDFILPGGNVSGAHCHFARAVCRRAERHFWKLVDQEPDSVNASAVTYLNRLSDYLFVLARALVRTDNGQEVLWQTRLTKPGH